MNRDDKDPFAGLGRPRAPEGLRGRALEAAREAMDAPPVTIWETVWDSPVARLALAASLVALIAGHILLGAFPIPGSGRVVQAEMEMRGPEPEVMAVAAMPRIRLEPAPFE